MVRPQVMIEKLQSLIGTELHYQGMRCVLVEVLDAPAVVILRPIGAEPVIQADNFGKPTRHAPQLFEVPVLAPDGESLSAEMRLIGLPGDSIPAAE